MVNKQKFDFGIGIKVIKTTRTAMLWQILLCR
ncbi:MAG: hypothetical protein JSC189_000639 [Candidatus Tokpelaia sp. JSC189]|nr:MAG: hypothetical protein JSC189_000639 [Candidatus Tokpelaia sp. JSC189]